MTARLDTQHPEAFIIISGDYNHVTLESTLAAFHQAVNCPTRNNRSIDLLYTNVRDAYRATPLLPFGKSDHNLVHLQLQYTALVQRQSTTTRLIRKWSPEVEDALGHCFEATDWDVLLKSHGKDIEGQKHCLTDYLNFGSDVVAPAKTVHCYLNNKPWVTQEVKAVLSSPLPIPPLPTASPLHNFKPGQGGTEEAALLNWVSHSSISSTLTSS